MSRIEECNEVYDKKLKEVKRELSSENSAIKLEAIKERVASLE